MSAELRELYKSLIIDHGLNPRHFGELPKANRTAEGFNPFCGDKLTVYLQVNLDTDIIESIRFKGIACAISFASASLMAEQLHNKTLQEAQALFTAFHQHVTNHPHALENQTKLGKLAALLGVRSFPSRIKCATLAWHALHSAINQADPIIKTE